MFGVGVVLASNAIAATPAKPYSFPFQAVQEKRNAILNIDNGMVTSFANEEKLDGLTATTRDFQGRELTTWVRFNSTVTDAKLEPLAEHQGRIKGSVVCKRVLLGSSPEYPHVKTGVLGEDCTVKAIPHYR